MPIKWARGPRTQPGDSSAFPATIPLVISHETSLRVRYAETDQMGVVYYANYFVWMELGRAEYCRAAGIRYETMEREDRILLAVTEAHCRYLYPARYDQEIAVEARVARSNRRTVEFEYTIREASAARKLATGHTKHIFLGPDMRPVKLPEKYFALFGIDLATADQT